MIRQLFFLLCISFSITVAAVQENVQAENTSETEFANTHFISDDLFIYMHSGPGTNYRIIGSVNAGSQIILTQQDTETEFSEITDERGRSGWVKSEFVTTDKSVRTQLAELQAQVNQQGDMSSQYSQELSQLDSQLQQAQMENQSLKEENQSLRAEMSTLSQELEQNSNDTQKEMFFMGAIVAGSGLIFGIILTMLLKGRKRSDVLYDRY